MKLYYLENKLAGKSPAQRKYYTGNGDMEQDGSTNTLKYARFYLTEKAAQDAIKNANSWWEPHDYEVKSTELDKIIPKNAKIISFDFR